MRTSIFDEDYMRRVCIRIAHEIIERNKGAQDLVLIGLLTRGALFASRLGEKIAEFEGVQVPTYSLDFTQARDDLDVEGDFDQVHVAYMADKEKFPPLLNEVEKPDFSKSRVIIVDDVLFTGRSVRAALSIISAVSRPKMIQLAVLIDRGHRELPILADYVGKNVPTNKSGERVNVKMREIDNSDAIELEKVSLA